MGVSFQQATTSLLSLHSRPFPQDSAIKPEAGSPGVDGIHWPRGHKTRRTQERFALRGRPGLCIFSGGRGHPGRRGLPAPLRPAPASEAPAQRGCIEAQRRAGTSHSLFCAPGGAGGARAPFELPRLCSQRPGPSKRTLPAPRPRWSPGPSQPLPPSALPPKPLQYR